MQVYPRCQISTDTVLINTPQINWHLKLKCKPSTEILKSTLNKFCQIMLAVKRSAIVALWGESGEFMARGQGSMQTGENPGFKAQVRCHQKSKTWSTSTTLRASPPNIRKKFSEGYN